MPAMGGEMTVIDIPAAPTGVAERAEWAKRHTLTRYTRYLTVVLASFQAIGVSIAIQGQMVGSTTVVVAPGLGFMVTATITLVTGTVFLMWLGEQVTERGVGNGV